MNAKEVHKEVCKGIKLLSRAFAAKRRQHKSPDDKAIQTEFDEALTVFCDFAYHFGFSESEYDTFRRAFPKVKTTSEFAVDVGMQSDVEISHASFHELAANRIMLIHELMNWDTCQPSDDSDPSLSSNELLTRLKQEMAFVEPEFKADGEELDENLVRKIGNLVRKSVYLPKGKKAYEEHVSDWEEADLKIVELLILEHASEPRVLSESEKFNEITGRHKRSAEFKRFNDKIRSAEEAGVLQRHWLKGRKPKAK